VAPNFSTPTHYTFFLFLEVKGYPKLFQQLHPRTSQVTADFAAAQKLGATRPNQLQSFSQIGATI
jgi:hypothetical protein